MGKHTLTSLVACSLALAILAGCDTPVGAPPAQVATYPAPPPPPPPPQPNSESIGQPAEAATASQVAAEAPLAGAKPAATAASDNPPPAQPPPIRLSAGVAVPQSLPEGTQIGVSVDYRLIGRLSESGRYLLAIESKAKEVTFEVQLSPQGGTLQGFCPPSVRPEDQPFRARIDELRSNSSRVTVSNVAPLQASF